MSFERGVIKLFLASLISVALIGCSQQSRNKGLSNKDLVRLENTKQVVVFVPGYKGSVLADSETKNVTWLTASEALFGKQTLAWNSDTLVISGARDFTATGVLKKVPLFWGLGGVDIYGQCLEQLQTIFAPEFRLVEFYYDWRQDNVQTAAELESLVRGLKREGATRVILVAHSMGALVTAYYLRYGSQLPESAEENWSGASEVDEVVLLAAPFRGSTLMFRDMQRGTVNGRNSKILNAQAITSFPSAYQLLPAAESKIVYDLNGQNLPGFHGSLENWREFNWGLMQFSTPDNGSSYNQSFTKMFQRGREIQAKILAPFSTKPLRRIALHYFYGEKLATLSSAVWLADGQNELLFDDHQLSELNLPFTSLNAEGDGTVTTTSAQLPEAYREAFASESNAVRSEHRVVGLNSSVIAALKEIVKNDSASP